MSMKEMCTILDKMSIFPCLVMNCENENVKLWCASLVGAMLCVFQMCCPFPSSLLWISAFPENGFLKASALPVEDGKKRQNCENETFP